MILITLSWAIYTQHVWEDYYITYRASKNLAIGEGLTYTSGERIHSFTSPLGVLLPAAASLLTGNQSDDIALWIFRLMASAALAGSVIIMGKALNRAGAYSLAAGAITALIFTDAKIIDFTINGMETPFLLLFLAWTSWASFTNPRRQWLHLGLSWGGLMWTRPDAFIYIGVLSVGIYFFKPSDERWWKRVGTLRMFLKAGLLTSAVYGPWLLWAWQYYGTPVPHTVTAKGLFLPHTTPGLLAEWLLQFPMKMWGNPSILAGTFMPAYSFNTGWPGWMSTLSAIVAVVAMLLWLLPNLRWEARVLSLTVFGGQFYLYSFVGFPIPWYLPPITFLSLMALGVALMQLSARSNWKKVSWVAFALFVATEVTLSLAVAWQLRYQQSIVEGQRREIGEWLKKQSVSTKDTVFLEPLGYIGFFSGLKMLDYPGLSSPEVVAARLRAESHSYPFSWSEIIMDLQPDWLVLRSYERDYIRNRDPEVLTRFYQLVKTFDVRKKVEAIKFLPGRGYLTNDALFEVYKRQKGYPAGVSLKRIKQSDLIRRDSWGQPAYDSGQKLLAHAPSLVEFELNRRAKWLSGGIGFIEGAYSNPTDGTDGAIFTITQIDESGNRTVLWERELHPLSEKADRGLHPFKVKLREELSSSRIELKIDQGIDGNNAYDWTYWSDLIIQTPHDW